MRRRTRLGGPRAGLVAGAALVALVVVGLSAVRATEPDGADAAAPGVVRERFLGDPMTSEGQRRRAGARLGRQHTPSALIIPDQVIPLRFSHRLHAGIAGCGDCHGAVRSSVRAKDRNLPAEATCLRCHDIVEGQTASGGDLPSRCSTCHPGFEPEWLAGADRSDTKQVKVHPPRVLFPTPNLKFNHRLHLDKGARCAVCHGDVSRLDLATRDNSLPLMGRCLECHDGKKAPDACTTCHVAQPDGRVQTRLEGRRLTPAGWYRGDAHDDRWLHGHRGECGLGDAYCASCHTHKECIDCHNGVSKPLSVHPNNWVLTHTIAARRNVPDCASCHRSQTFCVDCHQQTKVVAEAPNTPPDDLRFHPEGWVDGLGRRGSSHHAFEAQRNIRSCASCHTEDTCTQCHSPGGLNVNPHPPGFLSTGACDRMRSRNDRVCTKCHAPGSAAMRCRR